MVSKAFGYSAHVHATPCNEVVYRPGPGGTESLYVSDEDPTHSDDGDGGGGPTTFLGERLCAVILFPHIFSPQPPSRPPLPSDTPTPVAPRAFTVETPPMWKRGRHPHLPTPPHTSPSPTPPIQLFSKFSPQNLSPTPTTPHPTPCQKKPKTTNRLDSEQHPGRQGYRARAVSQVGRCTLTPPDP
jgi:hypothetical protein